MEYFITCLIYLLYPPGNLSFVYCAAANSCSILAACSGMGCVGSWTLWSLWVPSKLRHSVVYVNKCGADAESGSVYLAVFEMVPLPDGFSVPPCKCSPCCRMVSQGELEAFWCNSQLGCSDTGATLCSPPCTSPAPAAPPEPQHMIHFCLEAGWTSRAGRGTSQLTQVTSPGWILTLSKARPFFTSCQICFHTSTSPSWLIWPLKLSQ